MNKVFLILAITISLTACAKHHNQNVNQNGIQQSWQESDARISRIIRSNGKIIDGNHPVNRLVDVK